MALILSRSILLITIITISTLIGGIFVIKLANPSFQVNPALISNPQDNSKYQIKQDLECCGHTDVTPPTITSSPTNKSIVLAGSTINLEVIDDNPFYENKADEVLYHWDKDQSNTTVEDQNNDLIYEVVLPNDNGTYLLYVYAGDHQENWRSVIFLFIVIPAGDPPTINFIAPSASNETLTGNYIFRVNVNDDFGPLKVKMQIDSGATPNMNYNETSGYYDRSYNVSELTNGYHWLKVTATDIDEKHHTVTENIDFTVVGGQETALVSNPPEWDAGRSDLPANLSDFIEEDRLLEYVAESGDINFKIVVKDDKGIAVVDFTVYAINSFDPTTGETNISDAQKELTQSLSKSGNDGDWDIYEYIWESALSSDNFYLCEVDVQDTDEVVNHLYIRIILEIDNVAEPITGFPDDDAPGFLLLSVIMALIGSVRIIIWRRKKREV